MNKKLYVSGLASGTSEATLQALFSQVGTVAAATLITDPDTGLGNGYGFVEMSNESEAYHAISLLDGTLFEGETIVVREVPPHLEHNQRVDNRGGYNRY